MSVEDVTANVVTVRRDPPPGLVDGASVGPFQLKGEVLVRAAANGKPWLWRATDNRVPGRPVVVKLYRLSELDEDQERRLHRESELALRWSGLAGVVTTYSAEQVGNWWVISMEPMGFSLRDHVEARARGEQQWLPATVYARWIGEAAVALNTIHAGQVLHRDVTLGNILVTPDGEHAKVCDFSIARAVDQESVTGAGAAVGTYREMAPEAWHGEFTPRTDQCQLARVAWWLLTGEPIGRDPGGRLNVAARRVLERAAAQDPRDRYVEVQTFAVLLATAIERGKDSAMLTVVLRLPPMLRPVVAGIAPLMAFLLVLAFGFFIPYLAVDGGNQVVGIGLFLPTAILCIAALAVSAWMRERIAPRRRTKTRTSWARQAVVPAIVGAATFLGFLWLTQTQGASRVLALLAGVGLYCTAEVLRGVAGSPSSREGGWTLAVFEALIDPRGRQILLWPATLVAIAGMSVGSFFYGEWLRSEPAPQDQAAPADSGREALITIGMVEGSLIQGTLTKACESLARSHPWRKGGCEKRVSAESRRRVAAIITPETRRAMRRALSVGAPTMTVKRSLGGSKAEAAAAYYELYQENGKIKVSYRQMLPGASVVAASASRVTVEVGLPTGEIVRHDLARMGEGWQVLRSATREGSSDWRPSTG